MSRHNVAYEVTRKSETPGRPDMTAVITRKTTYIYDLLRKAGSFGITTRDVPGYDLRHYLREMRNLGIGIDREWEKHDGGQHGRWTLRAGHSHREIPYPKKKKPVGKRASDSNITDALCEGSE